MVKMSNKTLPGIQLIFSRKSPGTKGVNTTDNAILDTLI